MNINLSAPHVKGLDAIRFFCALWVLFGHGASPEVPNPFAEGTLPNLAFRAALANFWNGQAAVIVFFVISGFCIHYPFAGTNKKPVLTQFYIRRFVRLLLPLAVAIPLAQQIGVHLTFFETSILWSLIAELIYYALYPFIRFLQLCLGSWLPILMVSFVCAFVIAGSNPSAGNFASFGIALNWLVGLPSWLLGCVVAEAVRREALFPVVRVAIWSWRLAIVSAGCICSVLRYHSSLTYPWTLNLFAVLAALWLKREIAFHQYRSSSRFFEWAGQWSYSLYLVHVPAGALFVSLFPPQWMGQLRWPAMFFFILLICYLFYLLVEAPAHSLARRAAKKIK